MIAHFCQNVNNTFTNWDKCDIIYSKYLKGRISLKINFQTVFCGFCRKNHSGNLAKAKPAANHFERKLLQSKSHGSIYELQHQRSRSQYDR